MSNKTYKVSNGGVAISTAITLIQLKAGSANPFELLRATVTQGLSVISSPVEVQILRTSTAGTVTSSTPILFDPRAEASGASGGTSATGITATAEGTAGDILVEAGFNVLNGWVWLPTPEERIFVEAGGYLALKFPTAPDSHTFIAEMVFQEF